jgi:acetoin utilization deacetylase AcuC-like enzyme
VKAFYCDRFVLPLPDGHRFPMEKYSLLRERVLAEGLLAPGELLEPEAATDEQLASVHCPDYVRRVVGGRLGPRELRALGFPWSPGLVERSRRSVGGTIAACRAALDEGVGVNLAGGTHHAFRDRGEGFCVFNDVAVAFSVLRDEGRVRRAAVIDTDVHQGNGTAALFADEPEVFTFSVHGERNYPLRKERSDLDLGLADGTGDEPFLEAVERGLEAALSGHGAELVTYLSGADAHERDRLGRLGVTAEGLAERDLLVFERCRRAGAAVALVMGGGYGEAVGDTVAIHFASVAAARQAAGTVESTPR